MHVYYFDEPLTERDLQFVAEEFELECPPEQVQIPHVLPVVGSGPIDSATSERHRQLLRNLVRRAGIGSETEQPIFVAPSEMYWLARLTRAIFDECGFLPYMIQTEKQRQAIGNPGSTRILDVHGISGFEP